MPSVLRDIRGAGMQNLIYPRLPRAEQRVVPTVLGFFYKTNPFNASMLARPSGALAIYDFPRASCESSSGPLKHE